MDDSGRVSVLPHLRERGSRIPAAKYRRPGHHPIHPRLYYFTNVIRRNPAIDFDRKVQAFFAPLLG